MGRRLPLAIILLLLAAGGVALALVGWRTIALERAEALRAARSRVARALKQAARDLVERPEAWPFPPQECWTAWQAAPGPEPSRSLWAQEALFALRSGDAEGAAKLYERALAEAPEGEAVGVLLVESALALWRSGRGAEASARSEAAQRWAREAGDRHLELEVLYLLASQGASSEALVDFLEATQDGRLLGEAEDVGPDALLLSLAETLPAALAPPAAARLRSATQRALQGRALRLALGEAQLAHAAGWILVAGEARVCAYRPQQLANWQGDVHGLALKLVPSESGEDPPDGVQPLSPPLQGLALVSQGPPADASSSGGHWLLLAGLSLYAGGVLLLLQALARARHAQRMQGEFVAAVSHELKTPIASVRAMAEALADGAASEPERTRRYAQRIESEMLRLGRTVRNVLDVSRIERPGSLALGRAPSDPAQLVEEAAQAFGPAIARRGQELVWEAGPASGLLDLDREALLGVLLNLLDNAAKFSPMGGTVELMGRALKTGGYRMEVRDRGPGIAPHEHERLFRRFERLGAAVKDAVPGVGLGLYVAAQVVHSHGGRIFHEPRPGGGSVFVVELKAAP